MKNIKNEKGFSLMEMVIIAVLIGVLAALAVPSLWRGATKLKVKNQARDIISDLRSARSRAVTEKTQFGVYFDLIQKQYIFFKDTDNPGSFTFSSSNDSVLITESLGAETQFTNCTFNNNVCIFTPSGTCSTSGQIRIRSSDNRHHVDVDVLASTGRIKVSGSS